MSVKALLNYVLEEVAIEGEKGTSIQHLFQYVNDFYVKNRQERHDISGLCSKAINKERASVNGDSNSNENQTEDDNEGEATKNKESELLWGLPNVKEEFQEYVWDLLKREKDFSVGPKNEGKDMTLKEVVEKLKSGADNDWRVYASEECRWRVLTGHDPDPKKVPNALFKCLEVIGRHREAGLIQPELTKLTGQDKRSIAMRTTALKDLGYIEKVGVLARSMSTTKLTLIKFAMIRDLERSKEQQDNANNKGKKSHLEKDNWTGDIIHTEGLIKAIIFELKASKSGVLLRSDLKTRLGMNKSRFHWRSLSRILRRMEALGIWRRIKVPLNFNRIYRKKEGEGEQVVAEQCHARCLRFLRDPTDEDWGKIASSARAGITIDDEDEGDDGSDAEDEKCRKGSAEIDADAATALAKVNVDAMEEIPRELPTWNSNIPVANVIYNLIHATGTTGLSSMEVVGRGMGAFYYRPMDQILHRLTDFPNISQPTQYIHLAVIRETSITQRQTHYRYFSYPAHQELVQQGLATEPWGTRQKKKGSKVGSVGGESGVPKIKDVDEYGFPMVNTSRLVKKDGTATLRESQILGQKKENARSYTGQFTVQTNKDGTQSIDWRNSSGRTGRPRKYEPGKEPYLETKRRKKERENAEMERTERVAETTIEGTRISSEDGPADCTNTPGRIGPSKYEKSKEPNLETKSREEIIECVDEITTQGTKRPFEDGPIEDAEPPPPPKRRGRPPKKNTPEKRQPSKNASKDEYTPAKRRGRPPKKKTVEATALLAPPEPSANTEASPVAAPEPAPEPAFPPAPELELIFDEAAESIDSPLSSVPSTPAPEVEKEPPPTAKKRGRPRKHPAPVTPAKPKVTPAARSTRKRKASTPVTKTASPEKRGKKAESQPDAEIVDVSEETVPVEEPVPSQPQVTEVQPSNPTDSALGSSLNATINLGASQGDEVNETEKPSVPVGIPDDAEVPPAKEGNEVPIVGEIETSHPTANSTHTVDGTMIELDYLDGQGNESYNSIGGMLALGRQKVVLQLLAENNGVFPSGLELRHAFNKRYQDMNKKAGDADRRLVRGIIQSLQYKGKVNQITFTFENSRGIQTTKKLILAADTPLDAPHVTEMIREIKSADGNMWFPAGTALPDDIKERMLQPNNHMQPKPVVVIEGVEFDRLYPSPLDLLRKKRELRAAERATMTAEKEEGRRKKMEERAMIRAKKKAAAEAAAPGQQSHWVGKFTEEQRQEARRRKAELKAQAALNKLNNKFQQRNAEGDPQARDDNAPRKVWWNDYVDRTDGKTFHDEVNDIQQWELLMALTAKEQNLPGGSKENGEPVMINHFAPHVEKGDNFVQVSTNLDSMTAKGKENPPFELPYPTRKKPGPKPKIVRFTDDPQPKPRRRKAAPKPHPERFVEGQEPPKRRRRPATKRVKGPSRREIAMAAIHENTLLENIDVENDFAPKKLSAHRNTYAIPKKDEDTLLIAVIIVRTLFGSLDRKINWDIVQKAAPQHEAKVLRGRWPRVRDVHKTHLKRLQNEFETMYLKAYSKDQLPAINIRDPSSFDVPLHVNWFRDNLDLPEANTIPELPTTREEFDNLYTLTPERTNNWRADFHQSTATMGFRGNHFVCHAYQVPLYPSESTNLKPAVAYAQSIIRANIITDSAKYNPRHAFDLLRSQPEDAVDEAFYDLTYNKVIAHKKEHSRAAPGRNYELTDKFHLALRTPMDEKLFAQAVGFYRKTWENFKAKEPVILSPFMNDGGVTTVFDMLAHGRIELRRHNYTANVMGLIDGYETRCMPKHLVDFKIELVPVPGYSKPLIPKPLPPVPTRNPAIPTDPIRLWFDIEGDVVKGMWLRVLTAALSLVVGRPAITVDEIALMLKPGLTRDEARQAVQWLVDRDAVEARDCGKGVMGYWAKELFYMGLQGL